MKSASRRVIAPVAAVAAIGLVLTGCASGNASAPHGQIGTANGIVKVQGPIIAGDATLLEKSWAGWEKANHIKIEYTGSSNFEEEIGEEAQQGNAPDLAIFAEPGLVGDLASLGYLQPLPSGVEASTKSNFSAQWNKYVTFSGKQYATPLLENLDGWVFYNPKQLATLGISVPKTWAALYTMTSKIRAATGKAPWCEGFNSDASSGAAGTQWIEDLVLRRNGPTVYDEWVSHKIPFSDPRIEAAFNDADTILLNQNFVNAGLGGVKSINTASQADVAKAMENGSCTLTDQPSSFTSNLTNATGGPANISPTGDYWAFLLPPYSGTTTPVTGGGDFVAAFSNDSDTVKVQQYLTSQEWARSRVSLGGAVSPNINTGAGDAVTPLVQKSYTVLDSPTTVFRFEASALMPSVVGSGTFLTGMVDWINGTSTSSVLSTIDGSWPTN